MNVPRERLDVLDRRRRQDAVTEVEDVARPAAGALEHVVGGREHPIERAEQQRRIEVALDRAIGADALPRLVERRAPVGADHVAAGVAQLARIDPVPTPKWIVGTPSGATRSKIVCVCGRMNSR